MNDRRYRSYLHVTRVVSSDLFNALEREALLDAAEGLLLMSSPHSSELSELERKVDAALEGLIAGGRIHAGRATELRERISECGPPGVTLVAA
jgi:hypothetical protein